MLEALGRHPGTPVPAVTFTETDPTVLGAPFFVMPRVPGRIPSDVPSWHQHGWTTGLGAEGISTMYDSGLAALAALHRIDWRDGFDFLAAGPTSRGLPAYLAEVERSYDWAAPSLRFEPDDLERALRWVLEHAPDDRAEGIVWGDARLGNLIFGDDLGVAAMLDWETACLGPPGIDLGWWLMFEDFLCAAQGIVPLPGTPGRDEIVRRYEALGGGRITGLDYYEVLACVTMSIINSRLGDLLQRRHALSDERAGTWARRTIAMATRRLDRILD
jgi:aminoglycoside phosphotransferase (APT) family kinase protein